ncbi:hypothetical protein DES40_1014 [Litorimonas taeanensis]|uniref:Stringent starvation protein B n=1 Tax=Litorimonas taeanensis TaxID=568099 RepID=A0A420WLA2_9PROT|nr:ClpXP protease specificity-enhancing factor SspB [Litorimonas taeanensis]RKQ71686.1 hypothetical protein DES40_1014 [Litorimonas taeanensis]
MSQDLMNYDQMTQLALRGVVRDAIRRVIREDGLPGAHHFYITFLTRYPGVEIDETLAKKYPEEITIVLEHQFWDLNAYADEFEVTLKFGGIPKYLKVPYLAISRFHDPSVGFALQFDPPSEMDPIASGAAELRAVKDTDRPSPAIAAQTETTATDKAETKKSGKKKAKSDKASEGDASDETANVVSLDAFRKK